jgi:alkane 1-monooxygenase
LFLLLLVAVVPAADALIGQDVELTNQMASQAPSGSAIPVTYICVWGIAVLVAIEKAVTARPLEFAGLVIASGVVSAFAMAHIHEVMHRGGRRSRLISDVALAVAGYPHYRVVHQLHHGHVGDPRFGSTAHVGLSVWRHVGRSFFSALRSAIAYELGQARHWRENRLLQIVLVSVAVVALFAWLGGWRGAVFYLGQGIFAVFVVETVGYLQHYGLSGTPDELGNQVAWDVNFWLSNRLFVNNGLHTHHHLEQTRTYDRLVHAGRALPGGYLHMFGLSLIPSLWFSVMDHRLPKARD